MSDANIEAAKTETKAHVPDAVPESVTWFGNGLSFLDSAFESKTLGGLIPPEDRLVIAAGESGTLKSRLSYGFLASGFQYDNAGALLFSSEGISQANLVIAMKEWGVEDSKINSVKPSSVLVRRILPRFISGSALVFRLRMCIRDMKRRLHIKSAIQDGWRLRVVIDNWSSIIDAHECLQKDRQLLQAVHMLLRDEGVLAMIVTTQSGSPASRATYDRIHDATQLEATRILTWPLDFFGDRKIAVTTSLPGTKGRRNAVGEMLRVENKQYKVAIQDNFDAYEDIELGKPKRVDLKVRLYSGHEISGTGREPTASSYNKGLSALFGDLFASSVQSDDVVTLENTSEYDAFKDYIQHLESTHINKSLVFQVDEFWKGESENAPFAEIKPGFAGFEKGANWDDDSFPRRAFANTGLNRIPLHKDFGIILADRAAWYQAREIEIEEYDVGGQLGAIGLGTLDVTSIPIPSNADSLQVLRKMLGDHDQMYEAVFGQIKASPDRNTKPARIKVGHVWNALCLDYPGENFADCELSPNMPLTPSWELFLSACEVVSEQHGKRAFDLDFRTSETFSSFVLEIWFSAILNRGIGLTDIAANDLWHSVFESPIPFREFVSKNIFELDYSIRLAAKVLGDRYRENPIQFGKPDADAVAFRAWYATGVLCQNDRNGLAPLRLPGRACVRGDWYLATARGSRSLSVAEAAIRKLVSLPMNIKRLRDGVGLPVRDSDNSANVETALTSPDPALGKARSVRFSELRKLEPKRHDFADGDSFPPLTSLFRSCIPDYDKLAGDFFRMVLELTRFVRPLKYPEKSTFYRKHPTDDGLATQAVGGREDKLEEEQIKAIYEQFAGKIDWERKQNEP